MNIQFAVERIALHRIDKAKKLIEKAPNELKMSAFTKDDRDAVGKFFSDHLQRLWEAPDGASRVSAANFNSGSGIKADYKDLVKSAANFLARSQGMADSLFNAAPVTSSAGILITLWLRTNQTKRPFLALLKMDPGRDDKISLRQTGGKVLLELAVQHIEQALPDTGDRVLKWAVTPHPNQAFDVKIRDRQTQKDPAAYFMKFLGCEAQRPEREQIGAVYRNLTPAAIDRLRDETEGLEYVDFDSIRKSNALTPSQFANLQQQLASTGLSTLQFSAQAFQNVKPVYKLENGIVIKGPWDAMNSVVINELGKNDLEFRIRTTGYDKSYE